MITTHARAAAGLALLVLVVPSVGSAQVLDEAAVEARITVSSPTATVVPLQDLDFGNQTTGTIVRSSDVPAFAQWEVSFSAAGTYQWAFSLPTQLTGTAGSVPITFGQTALRLSESNSAYDPNALHQIETGGPFSMQFFLGEDFLLNDGSGDVVVDLTGAADGVYTGSIMLTVRLP